MEGAMMKCELADKTCEPCRGGVPPLKGQELADLAAQLGAGWAVIDAHHLELALQRGPEIVVASDRGAF